MFKKIFSSCILDYVTLVCAHQVILRASARIQSRLQLNILPPEITVTCTIVTAIIMALQYNESKRFIDGTAYNAHSYTVVTYKKLSANA